MKNPTQKLLVLMGATVLSMSVAQAWPIHRTDADFHRNGRHEENTATPIKHLVVIYNENVSFDHYFATYPEATNPTGEPNFHAMHGTPQVNNLANNHLLTNNPNYTNTANGFDAAEPFRLDRTQASTADQNHAYTAEEQAYDGGAMDLFPKYTGSATSGGVGAFGTKGQVMGYYDGNTVTSMWNYAQRFAMNDNAYTDTYGPSTPGALEAVAGQTNGMVFNMHGSKTSYYVPDGQGGYTMINDVDPAADVCSSQSEQVWMTGKNIGDLLNNRNISWGSFMGGFDLGQTNDNGTNGCGRSTFSSTVNETVTDYIPHHAWFQYYQSTSNPTHARPNSIAAVGHTQAADETSVDPANHEYDVKDFYSAVKAGNFPAVSYVKAPAYQDGHGGYSDPLDEQIFTTELINFLQHQPGWENTVILITWDDSDGWYDHAFGDVTSPSMDPTADQLNGPGKCGDGALPKGLNGKPVNGRCGPGTRIPFLVISPYAKSNYVGHKRISQASIVRFIEDNWLHGERLGGGSFDATAGSLMDMFAFNAPRNGEPLYLDPQSGMEIHVRHH